VTQLLRILVLSQLISLYTPKEGGFEKDTAHCSGVPEAWTCAMRLLMSTCKSSFKRVTVVILGSSKITSYSG